MPSEKCFADMAELVDALDLGSGAVRRGGSTPSIRTLILMGLLVFTNSLFF